MSLDKSSQERAATIAGKNIKLWKTTVEIISVEKSTHTSVSGGAVDGFTYKGTGITWGSSLQSVTTVTHDIWLRLPDAAETKLQLVNFEPNFRAGHFVDLIFARDEGSSQTYLVAVNNPSTRSLDFIPNALFDYFAFTRFVKFALKWIPLGLVSPLILLGIYSVLVGDDLQDIPIAVVLLYLMALFAVFVFTRIARLFARVSGGFMENRNSAVIAFRREISQLYV